MDDDGLILVGRPNPEEVKYIRPGTAVWWNSGSPMLRVIDIIKNECYVGYYDGNNIVTFSAPIQCFTVEPTPPGSIQRSEL